MILSIDEVYQILFILIIWYELNGPALDIEGLKKAQRDMIYIENLLQILSLLFKWEHYLPEWNCVNFLLKCNQLLQI